MEFVSVIIIFLLIIFVAIALAMAGNEDLEERAKIKAKGELGSAGFGESVIDDTKRPPILLGYDKNGKDITYSGEGHLLAVGHTRSGKGVGVIIPNLKEYPGSIVVLDPKGENTVASLKWRENLGQKCIVIDPWNITGLSNGKYDPIKVAQKAKETALDDARIIAESIIPLNANIGQAFWEEEARSLISTICLYFILGSHADAKNLGDVILALGDSAKLEALLKELSIVSLADGAIARGARQYLDKAPSERSGVLSTARQHSSFLDAVQIRNSMAYGNFCFSDVFKEPTTVFIVLPVWKIATYGRWIRVVIAMAITELARSEVIKKTPVLFIIDEFASLGRLSAFDSLFSLLAGYGVQLWPIVQDLNQLKSMYLNEWESFVANAAVLQNFGTRDLLTAEYLSNRMGGETVAVMERSASNAQGRNAVSSDSVSSRLDRRQLKYPDEVTRFPRDQGIVLVEECSPVVFTKIRYFSDIRFMS